MTRRSLFAAASAVLLGAVGYAQGGATDRISGSWGSDGVTFLELRFDGKRTVSGTAIWRHGSTYPRRGSFRPQTIV